MRDGKFLKEIEELIDIAHKAHSGTPKQDLKQQFQEQINQAQRTSQSQSQSSKSSEKNKSKRKSRLTGIQKAFILSEILPRKY